MAKRGRKKGGLRVNSIDDRDELTSMIINQINSLNKKIKAFNEQGITEQYNFVKNILTDDMAQFTNNGTISKSKKFYKDKNLIWLKKSLAALHKINNHYAYGTVKKYESELTKSMEKVKNYVDEYLRKKGYDDNFINKVTNSKDFYVKLFDEYGNVSGGYGSDQAIEKIALSYEDETGITEKERNKILNNIEYSRNTFERLLEEQKAVDEIRNRKRR